MRPRRGYGEVLTSEGTTATDYAFTGESYDPQTGLVYLRARYYNSVDGRFVSRDTWAGNANTPMSYNLWAYGYDNPIKFTDPTGYYPGGERSDQPSIPTKPVPDTCQILSGEDRLTCVAIYYGVNPDKKLPLITILALYIQKSCDGRKNFGNYFSPPRIPGNYKSDARQYGVWFHYMAENTSGIWNHNGEEHVEIQQMIATAFTREVTKSFLGEPTIVNLYTRAFAVKMWDPKIGFYRYMGGREVIQRAVTISVFGHLCPVEEYPGGCLPLSEYDKVAFTNHMTGPGTIANMEAYKIIHDQALRQKTSDAPWDYGNPTAKSPQPLLDALKKNNMGKNKDNVLYVNTDYTGSNYTDIFFFVTESQSIYLCNNASCIE